MDIPYGALATVLLFAVAHTASLIWWMSRTTTVLDSLVKTVDALADKIVKHEAIHPTKEEIAKDIGFIEKQLEAVWKRIDNCPCGSSNLGKD